MYKFFLRPTVLVFMFCSALVSNTFLYAESLEVGRCEEKLKKTLIENDGISSTPHNCISKRNGEDIEFITNCMIACKEGVLVAKCYNETSLESSMKGIFNLSEGYALDGPGENRCPVVSSGRSTYGVRGNATEAETEAK